METHVWQYTAIALAVWILQTAYKAFTSPLRSVPGPFYTNITRFPLKISIITGKRIYFIHNLHQKYGPIVRISPDEVSISSLPDFKEIHRAGSPFLKTKWYEEFVMAEKPGIFSMRDLKEHAARRKLFARAFSKTDLRRTWEGVVKEKVQLAVSQIQQELQSDGKADLLKWWTFLATDVTGHLMFGESFNMLKVGKKNEYIRILESTMMGSGINAELPLVGMIGRSIPIPSFKAMFRASDYLAEYGRRAVTNSRAASDTSRNIFSTIIYESEKGTQTLTDLDVTIEAGNLIVAGSDTTAITLTYLVWAVLSHPKLRRDLEDEVRALNAGYDDAALEELPVLNATIKETLRLYGAAPGSLPRCVPEGGATLSGHFLPHGVTVSTQSYTIHRDKNIFPDPELFDVSRWLPGEKNVSNQVQMAFSPFGAGSRICIGINLAYMELRLAVAEFFRGCTGAALAPSANWDSMKPENYFLIAPSGHKCEIIMG